MPVDALSAADELGDRWWGAAATPALRARVPIKVVSERIGHADPAVTMQV